jgi:hypothetical protein
MLMGDACILGVRNAKYQCCSVDTVSDKVETPVTDAFRRRTRLDTKGQEVDLRFRSRRDSKLFCV